MKIGILTSFNGMMDHYSLTSVVKTQLKMIHAAGHQPVLMAEEGFNWTEQPEWVEVRRPIPNHTKVDYRSIASVSEEHKLLAGMIGKNLVEQTQDLDAILAHDLLFTGWHVPIGMGVHIAAKQRPIPWMHWVHSVPGGYRDYWLLPQNSYLVYPNHTDRVRCAENFRTWPEKVLVIPHCCDLRDFHIRTPLAERIITDLDLLGADLVQVYPIPTDRAESKGIEETIRLFANFKLLGRSVRLVIPNAWCNVPQWRAKVDGYLDLARDLGLSKQEVVFTSKTYPEHELGISLDVISDLATCANIFICPTRSETFGLSLAEQAMTGSLLILNEDLPMMQEICGGKANAIWAKFSSNFQTTVHKNQDRYLLDISKIALHIFDNSPELRSKTYYRQRYRREAVWGALESAILHLTAAKQSVSA